VEPKDLPGNRYLTIFKYPKPSRGTRIPLIEKGVRTTETEDQFRVGLGHAFRFPLLRWAVVSGFWVSEVPGDSDEEKLRNVLKARDIDDEAEAVREYYA